MNKFFKIVSGLIVVLALGGGVYLVGQNANTKKGATQAETSSSVLPSVNNVSVNQPVSESFWVNTGNEKDKLSGLEMMISYDPNYVKLTDVAPMSGYTLLNDVDQLLASNGSMKVGMVAMGEEKSGAVNYLKLTFKTLKPGKSIISARGKIMITGQSNTWDVAKGINSEVNVSGIALITPTTVCKTGVNSFSVNTECGTGLYRYAKFECYDGTGGLLGGPTSCKSSKVWSEEANKVCVGRNSCVKSTPTPTAGDLSCGKRCFNNAGCGNGGVCFPLWWPCNDLPKELIGKFQNNSNLSGEDVSQLAKVCPQAVGRLVRSADSVKMPAFYGVCRKAACVMAVDCICKPTQPTPTAIKSARPTVRKIGPPVVTD